MLINIDGYTIETKEIISVSDVVESYDSFTNSVGFSVVFTNKKSINFTKEIRGRIDLDSSATNINRRYGIWTNFTLSTERYATAEEALALIPEYVAYKAALTKAREELINYWKQDQMLIPKIII